ncbi:MAG: class I SAM-dependent methyltransferase [Candidatus Hodarchaeota archaeon]
MFKIELNNNFAKNQVLDVGCSDRPLGDVNIDLYTHFTHRGESIIQVQADGKFLPFKDNSFGLVRSQHVVEHLENPYAFIREIARVTRKYVYIATPNAHNWRYIIHDDLDSYGDIKIAHRYQGFSAKCLSQMFKFAGLKVVKVVYTPITDPYSEKWAPRKLDRFLKWIPRFNLREIQVLGKKITHKS